MILKDEIERLIRAEQEKLDKSDQKTKEHSERQKQRFIPMRAIIEEISKSIEPEYIRVSISDSHAMIEVGRKKARDNFEDEIRWEIQPNYQTQVSSESGVMYLEQPGFRVEERLIQYEPEILEHTYTFKDEQLTAEYLLKKIAEKVARYRHLEALVKSRAKK